MTTAPVSDLAALSFASLFGAVSVAQIPSETSIEAFGKWPVTIGLIALCAWSLWLAFRQVEKSIQAHTAVADALREMSKLLAERPCVRDPKND